jgi:hypothetical protein
MSGEQKVQIVVLIIMSFTIIRMIYKMPTKVRIIVITIMLALLALNWYMVTYQEDTVNVIRNFFNLGDLRSTS